MGPEMAYPQHYNFYRINTRFVPPIIEGSFNGYDWGVMSVLCDKTVFDRNHKNFWVSPEGVFYCRVCSKAELTKQPELHKCLQEV